MFTRLRFVLPSRPRHVGWVATRSVVVKSEGPMPDTLPQGSVLRYQHHGRAYTYLPDEPPPSRGVTIAIVGAAGNFGRQIPACIAAHRRDFAGMGECTLQVIGRREGGSLKTLVGLCSELRDGFDDFCPHLEVVCDLESVRADIIVMAAGATMSTAFPTTHDVARANLDVFETHAAGLVKHNKKALILMASDPVEYGVDVFLRAGFDPARVIGTSAHLDSLRFRRELASELGLPRQHIGGLVLGPSGLNMVPCWSTVNFAAVAHPTAEQEARLREMKEEGLSRLPKDIHAFTTFAEEIKAMVLKEDALAAAAKVSKQPADVRAAFRRYVSRFAGPLYPHIGMAEKIARMVTMLVQGMDIRTAAQVRLPEGFLGIQNHSIAAPVILDAQGVKFDEVRLDAREVTAIKQCAETHGTFLNTMEGMAGLRRLVRRKSLDLKKAKTCQVESNATLSDLDKGCIVRGEHQQRPAHPGLQ